MDTFDLTGRVAIVTGGNRGIGLGICRGLAKAGASVAIWARDTERTSEAVAELIDIGVDAAGFACDVSDPESVATALDATGERWGRVDSLFANAAVTQWVKFEEMDFEDWRRVLDVNVDGLFHTVHAVTRRLIDQGEGGSLVFTASLAARFGLPNAPHYTASKGATVQLARSLAVRLARFGIRVNVLLPGRIATEMTDGLQDDERFNASAMARTPMRRWGTPEDFEGPAVFLASDASRFMTGSEVVVDGGFGVA